MKGKTPSVDIVVVGAGPAGLGFGVTLRHLEIEDFVILDRATIGASFLRWPKQMRFITPSFNSNQFGTLDLNAVALHTSPAYSVGVEHPTGEEYAGYLRGIAKHFDLPVETGADVLAVEPKGPRRLQGKVRGLGGRRNAVSAHERVQRRGAVSAQLQGDLVG